MSLDPSLVDQSISPITRTLVAIYAQRADEYAAAARAAAQAAIGVKNANAAIARDNARPQPSRRFVLELLIGAAPATAPTDPAVDIFASTPSPIRASGAPGTVALLVFDVSPQSGDGFAQSVRYRHAARQMIHQTAKGFYVDEFNLAPGSIEIDAKVIFQGDPVTQVQVFMDLLNKAKMTTPLSPDVPKTLYFHDTGLGRSFIITQNDISISQSADELNIGRVTITASILKDYGAPLTRPKTADTSTNAPDNQATLLTYQSNGTTTALVSQAVKTIGPRE